LFAFTLVDFIGEIMILRDNKYIKLQLDLLLFLYKTIAIRERIVKKLESFEKDSDIRTV
jgi:hypothetical protein